MEVSSYRCITLLIATIVAGCSTEAPEQARSVEASQVVSIHIDYQYMGWEFFEEQFALVPHDDGTGFSMRAEYIAHGEVRSRDHLRVPTAAVEKILDSTYGPPWTRGKGVRMVASSLSPAEMSQLEPVTHLPPLRCTPRELQLMARRYVMRQGRASILDDYYGTGISWTDDYPFALLQVHLQDGSRLNLYSQSQKALMLPWHSGVPVHRPPASGENWDVSLSRAVSEVLPPRSRMRERLGTSRLPGQLNRAVQHAVVKECDRTRGRER